MNKTRKDKIILVVALAITAGSSISYMMISTSLHRKITLYDCTTEKNKYTPVRNIIQSGPEFIIINPKQTWIEIAFL